MEVDVKQIKKALGNRAETFEVVSPAMIAQFRLEEAPDQLEQVEVRRVGWQPERAEAVRKGHSTWLLL